MSTDSRTGDIIRISEPARGMMAMKTPRPWTLPSITMELETHCGEIYVTVTFDKKGAPFEVFTRFGMAGHCGAAIFDGMAKTISYALRSGIDPNDVVKALSGIRCNRGERTCMNALSTALSEAMAQITEEKQHRRRRVSSSPSHETVHEPPTGPI